MGFLTKRLQQQTVQSACLVAIAACLQMPAFAAHEVSFLIDTSGSMKNNDPNNLRQPAVRLASQMLPTDTQAGIWLFDSQTQLLQPFGTVNQDWKESSTRTSSQIHSRGQLTNIEQALQTAQRAFSPDADSKSIILLTDGQVDISTSAQVNQASRARVLDEVLQDLAASNIQVHTIALSKNTDQDLLQRLAVGTNGMYALADTADDLMKIFLRAFEQSIAADQVPLDNNTFAVDSSIHEFTALIFRTKDSPPSQLKTPSGELLSPAQPGNSLWFSDKLYDLVTVTSPAAGTWQLLADLDPENRVTIVSDLELNLDGLPNNLVKGQTANLKFFLSDDKGPITAVSLLSLLDIDFEQKTLSDPPKVVNAKVTSHSQGKVRTPPNGIFEAKLQKTLVDGEHEFTVTVDGKTFKREQTKRTRVFSHVLEAMVVDSGSDQLSKQPSSQPNYIVNLVPIQGLTDPGSLTLTASIKHPDGKIIPVAATPTKYGSWTVSVPPLQTGSDTDKSLYKVFVIVEGKTSDGSEFNLTQGPVNVDYSKPLSAFVQESQDLFASLEDVGNEQEQREVKAVIAPEPAQSAPRVPASATEATSFAADANPVINAKSANSQLSSGTNSNPDAATNTDAKPKTAVPAADKTPSNEFTADEPEVIKPEDEPVTEPVNKTAEQDSNVVEETPTESSKTSSYILYGAIGLFNVLLCIGAFFGGRRWLQRRNQAAKDEEQALLDRAEKAKIDAENALSMNRKPVAPPAPIEETNDSLTAEVDKISDLLDNFDDKDETG